MVEPAFINGHTFSTVDVLVVTLERDGCRGRGEAAGLYYRHDTPAKLARELEDVRSLVERGMEREQLLRLMRPGGARNAIDCALWDLEAKLLGKPVWSLVGIEQPAPLVTTFTCGIDTPENMALRASSYDGARAIKLKLAGDGLDGERVTAVRERLPHVWLSIDANQAFTRPYFDTLLPQLISADVSLIEQPFPVGQEPVLSDLQSPIPIAGDESVQTSEDIYTSAGKFDLINIKLDKCGGLTEALRMVESCDSIGVGKMIGNMMGTSLAMAPAFIIGQLCSIVDLDGPKFLTSDRPNSVCYERGNLICEQLVWGNWET